jgi:hypothetical protein
VGLCFIGVSIDALARGYLEAMVSLDFGVAIFVIGIFLLHYNLKKRNWKL